MDFETKNTNILNRFESKEESYCSKSYIVTIDKDVKINAISMQGLTDVDFKKNMGIKWGNRLVSVESNG